jgi:hypothetical protein
MHAIYKGDLSSHCLKQMFTFHLKKHTSLLSNLRLHKNTCMKLGEGSAANQPQVKRTPHSPEGPTKTVHSPAFYFEDNLRKDGWMQASSMETCDKSQDSIVSLTSGEIVRLATRCIVPTYLLDKVNLEPKTKLWHLSCERDLGIRYA